MQPQVILHNAVSADSRLDWVKPDLDLYYKLTSRWNEDTTLVGSVTILNLKEEIPPEDETVFETIEILPDDKRPLLVVPDSTGRVRTWHYLKKINYWKNFVALCTENTPENYFAYLKERHIEWIIAGTEHVDFNEAFEILNAKFGSKIIRADCGGTLNGLLLRQSLVDEVSLLIHPVLVGGISPQTFFNAKDLNSAKGIIKLKLIHFEKLKDDIIWLVYKVIKK